MIRDLILCLCVMCYVSEQYEKRVNAKLVISVCPCMCLDQRCSIQS